jgi:hypothetical protein
LAAHKKTTANIIKRMPKVIYLVWKIISSMANHW